MNVDLDNCRDLAKQCKSYKHYCKKVFYEKTMHHFCKKTCGFCGNDKDDEDKSLLIAELEEKVKSIEFDDMNVDLDNCRDFSKHCKVLQSLLQFFSLRTYNQRNLQKNLWFLWE